MEVLGQSAGQKRGAILLHGTEDREATLQYTPAIRRLT